MTPIEMLHSVTKDLSKEIERLTTENEHLKAENISWFKICNEVDIKQTIADKERLMKFKEKFINYYCSMEACNDCPMEDECFLIGKEIK